MNRTCAHPCIFFHLRTGFITPIKLFCSITTKNLLIVWLSTLWDHLHSVNNEVHFLHRHFHTSLTIIYFFVFPWSHHRLARVSHMRNEEEIWLLLQITEVLLVWILNEFVLNPMTLSTHPLPTDCILYIVIISWSGLRQHRHTRLQCKASGLSYLPLLTSPKE